MTKNYLISDEYDPDDSYPLHASGQASPTGDEPRDDVVEALHKVVEEVTGKPVERKKKGMGFIW